MGVPKEKAGAAEGSERGGVYQQYTMTSGYLSDKWT